jgi:hypothetical protein
MDERGRRWAKRAGVAAVVAAPLLLVGCCCARRPAPAAGPAHRYPPPAALVLGTPAGVPEQGDTVTQAAMRNILFHLDDDVRLHIRRLRGRMHDLRHTGVVLLDDKNALLLEITSGELGMGSRDLTLLLNRYVFGYRGSPLRGLVARMEGGQMVLTGVMHKGVDIPFQMHAAVSLNPQGMIRIHPTSMKICDIDGKGLMRALHVRLQDLLDLRGAHGVRVEGDDMILDPFQILPPPRIAGRLTGIRIEGDELVQVFGGPGTAGPAPLEPPVPARNYVYFRGGTLRMGKLFMVRAELEAVDADESDPFDFYLDLYRSQLVAGYHVTTRDDGMVAYMPDFDDLGTPAAARRPPVLPASPAARPPAP